MEKIKIVVVVVVAFLSVPVVPVTRKPDVFDRAASRFKVPVGLVRGIAYAETGAWVGRKIRARIRSRSGAIGIMQIMPRTGRYHCPGLDLEVPEQNIHCGALYIAWLRANYCGDNDYCVAASYLNGPNAVRRGKIGRHTHKYWFRVQRGQGISRI